MPALGWDLVLRAYTRMVNFALHTLIYHPLCAWHPIGPVSEREGEGCEERGIGCFDRIMVEDLRAENTKQAMYVVRTTEEFKVKAGLGLNIKSHELKVQEQTTTHAP